jgi:hypothetical protein
MPVPPVVAVAARTRTAINTVTMLPYTILVTVASLDDLERLGGPYQYVKYQFT